MWICKWKTSKINSGAEFVPVVREDLEDRLSSLQQSPSFEAMVFSYVDMNKQWLVMWRKPLVKFGLEIQFWKCYHFTRIEHFLASIARFVSHTPCPPGFWLPCPPLALQTRTILMFAAVLHRQILDLEKIHLIKT